MSVLARGLELAQEIQALFAQWMALSEAAITALEIGDDEALTEALAGRDTLRPRVEQAMEQMVVCRQALRKDPRSAGELRKLISALPLERIAHDLEQGEARLLARIAESRDAVQREIEQMEQAGPPSSGYAQRGRSPEGRALIDLVR